MPPASEGDLGANFEAVSRSYFEILTAIEKPANPRWFCPPTRTTVGFMLEPLPGAP